MQGNTDTPWIELTHARLRQLETGERAQLEALGVTPTDLVIACSNRVLRRFERAGIHPDRDSFNRALDSIQFLDLGLALAWEGGKERAWELYATEHRPAVLNAALRQGASRGQAEELADELPGFLLSAESEGLASPLARYDGSGSLRGWLCTIVRRRVLDAAKRSSKNEELPTEGLVSEQSGPTHAAERNELGQRLRDAGAQLRDSMSPRERLAFLLKYEQDLPQRKIAGLMGIGDSRVSRLIQQAYAKVRDRLASEFGAEFAEDSLPPEDLLLALGSGRDPHRPNPSPTDSSQENPAP